MNGTAPLSASHPSHMSVQDELRMENRILRARLDDILEHAHRNQNPEREEKFTLLPQVGFARFPDDFRDGAHGFVHRQRAGADVFQKSKRCTDGADDEAQIQNRAGGQRAVAERNFRQRRQINIRIAGERIGGGQNE